MSSEEANTRAGHLLEATASDDFETVVAILSDIDRSGSTDVEDAVNLLYAREYAREKDRPGIRAFADSNLKIEKKSSRLWSVHGAIIGAFASMQFAQQVPDLGFEIPMEDFANQFQIPELAAGVAGIYLGYRVGSRFDSGRKDYWINEDQVREWLNNTYISPDSQEPLPKNTEKIREKLYRDHNIDLY